MAELDGKVALITGASSGLGREFALALSKNAANVILAARRTQMLEALCDEINAVADEGDDAKIRCGRAVAIELDVSASEVVIDDAVEKAWAAFGYIDVLVNNAGTSRVNPLDQDETEWNAIFIQTCVAPGSCPRPWRTDWQPLSLEAPSSTFPPLAVWREACYLVEWHTRSRRGIIHSSKVLAFELVKYNIHANAIATGLFKSEITSGLFQKKWLSKVAKNRVPTKKRGDLTSVVLLLASEDSQYTTGSTFIVDGGESMPSMPSNKVITSPNCDQK